MTHIRRNPVHIRDHPLIMMGGKNRRQKQASAARRFLLSHAYHTVNAATFPPLGPINGRTRLGGIPADVGGISSEQGGTQTTRTAERAGCSLRRRYPRQGTQTGNGLP